MIRPQYHFRDTPAGLLAWDIRRLVELSATLPKRRVNIEDIAELDENHWFKHVDPTCLQILSHLDLIESADLSYPIILDMNGRVMDGMHRVCKAKRSGLTHVSCVQFREDPAPDYTGWAPDELPYE